MAEERKRPQKKRKKKAREERLSRRLRHFRRSQARGTLAEEGDESERAFDGVSFPGKTNNIKKSNYELSLSLSVSLCLCPLTRLAHARARSNTRA